MKSMFQVGFRQDTFTPRLGDFFTDIFGSVDFGDIYKGGLEVYKGYTAEQKAEEERKKAQAQAQAAQAQAAAAAAAGGAPIVSGVSNSTLILGGIGIAALALIFVLAKG